MSIHIHNISESKGVEYGTGKQHYQLCINQKVMAEFEHNFNEGLATCLRKAADAFEKKEANEWKELYHAFMTEDWK